MMAEWKNFEDYTLTLGPMVLFALHTTAIDKTEPRPEGNPGSRE